MKKRILSMLLCLCMVVCLLPTMAQASTGHEGWPDIDFPYANWHNMGNRVTFVTIDKSANEYFTGETSTDGIIVKGAGTTANLYFYNCTIDLSEYVYTTAASLTDTDYWFYSALEIADGATVNLYIAGNCTLKGGKCCAGIHKQLESGQLNIYVNEGSTLNVIGGAYAAGIGGNIKDISALNRPWDKLEYTGGDGSNISFYGPGTLNATGGDNGAGIGGGQNGAGSNVKIHSGTLNAAGGNYGAGIGGGQNGAGSNVIIYGGTVNAAGGYGGAGIGGGSYGAGSYLQILGGTLVTSTGIYDNEFVGRPFGGGYFGKSSDLTVAIGDKQHAVLTVEGYQSGTTAVNTSQQAVNFLTSVLQKKVKLSFENCTEADNWSTQKLLCKVCNRTLKTDTVSPEIGLKSDEKYTLTKDGNLIFPVTDDNSGVLMVLHRLKGQGAKDWKVLSQDANGKYQLPVESGVDYEVAAMDRAQNEAGISFHIRYVYTINYKVGDVPIKSVDCLEDAAVAAADIPGIPEKIGYTDTDPYWSVNTTDAKAIIAAAKGSTVNVDAVYTPNEYAITLPTGTGYTISPAGSPQSVKYGNNFEFSVNLQPGYGRSAAYAVQVDGVKITAKSIDANSATYSIEGVDAKHTVTVDGVASSDATLSALTLTSGTLSPALAPNQTAYTANVSNDVTAVTVTPTTNHQKATVTVNGKQPTESIPLKVGDNILTIKVTAEDGQTTKIYTVTVTRAPSSDATLSALTLTSSQMAIATNEPFDAARTRYTADVYYNVFYLAVTPTANHEEATVTVNGKQPTESIPLKIGDNILTIKVTAEDGQTTKIYTVTVTRAAQLRGNYVLIFDTRGGERMDSVFVVPFTTWALSANVPARFGYTFTGWYSDVELTSKIDTIRLTQNTTIYAGWKLNHVNPQTGVAFEDVQEGDWFVDSVYQAVVSGLFAGTSPTTFSPNAPMTRQQMWMVLARMSGKAPANMDEAQKWAMESGLSDGSNPKHNVTREQFVTLLWRFAGSPKATKDMSGYTDFDTVAGYAREAMRWAVENGIVAGTSATTLSPKAGASRAQVAALMMRYSQNIKK